MRTAILIDGGFFLRRFRALCGDHSPAEVAKQLHEMCQAHLLRQRRDSDQLYRIFYYDGPPLSKKVHHPLTRRSVDFSKSSVAAW